VATIVRRKICNTGATAGTLETSLNLAAAIFFASVSVTVRSAEYFTFNA
jgi:hypothetical protein